MFNHYVANDALTEVVGEWCDSGDCCNRDVEVVMKEDLYKDSEAPSTDFVLNPGLGTELDGR